MAKYVNVDGFCEELNTFCDNAGFDWYVPKYDIVRVMEKHIIEAEPIRYAKWIKVSKNLSSCSWCGNCVMTERTSDMFYCKCCGAKMYGE